MAGAFLAGAFLAAAFLAGAFLAGAFLAVAFLLGLLAVLAAFLGAAFTVFFAGAFAFLVAAMIVPPFLDMGFAEILFYKILYVKKKIHIHIKKKHFFYLQTPEMAV